MKTPAFKNIRRSAPLLLPAWFSHAPMFIVGAVIMAAGAAIDKPY
jgi:hypothetical protein